MNKIKIGISGNLRDAYPKIKVAFLEVKNVDNKKFDEKIEEKKEDLENFIRKNYVNVKKFEVIESYNNFFKKYEKKYPIQFQIESIINGKNIPSVSCAVESMFMAELKNMFLTAGHDLDSIRGSLKTKLSYGSESYVKINNAEQNIKAGDILTEDSEGIISSVLYGPDHRTRITENTKNCLFFSYFPFGIEDDKVKSHFKDIINNLKIFSRDVEASNVEIFSLSESSHIKR